mgnify:CR=1 FL=1
MGRSDLQTCRTTATIFSFPFLILMGCAQPGEDGAGADATLPGASVVASTEDEGEVTRLAHDFMEALSSRDAERLDGLLAPQAAFFRLREGESGPSYSVRHREEFLGGIAESQTEFLERIWEPVVEVSGRIAMVWAPYDFHSQGSLSHCGIDVLALLKMAEGWKVTSITYNVVQESCPPSPLGPPGG